MEVACMPATDHGDGSAGPGGLIPYALVSSCVAICPPLEAYTPSPALRPGCGALLPERLLVTVYFKNIGRVLANQGFGDGLSRVLVRTICLLYTSPSPRDRQKSRMPSSA